MEPFLVAAQRIHHGTNIVNYAIDYDAPVWHQVYGLPYLLEDFFLHTDYLREKYGPSRSF